MTEKRPLDAILFDIDDTLFSTSVFAEKARRAAVDAMIRHGLRVPRELALKELREVVEEFSSNYGYHFDKLLSRLPRQSFEGLNPAILVAAGMVAYHDTKFRDLRVYDDVYDVLRRLSATRIVRGVISAGLTVKQTEKILRLHIYEFLSPNAIFITEQIGIGKPNPKLFQRALDLLELTPERTMYVGDHPENDIAPCKQLGMIAVWNRRSGRHAEREASVPPDYEIRDFYELRQLLWRDFEIH